MLETKPMIVEAYRRGVESARKTDNLTFARIIGQRSDSEAVAAPAGGGRRPGFSRVHSAYSPDVDVHRPDIESS